MRPKKKERRKNETKEADIKREEKSDKLEREGDPINLQPGVNHMGGLPVWVSFVPLTR